MMLIVYSSKYGSGTACVEYLKSKLDDNVVICNIDKDALPNLNEFKRIIIGGSIYAGHISKKVRKMCINNSDILKEKQIGLFLVSAKVVEENDELFKINFGELAQVSIANGSFGGFFNANKMNVIEKLIIKLISKKYQGNDPKIEYDNIDTFAEVMNTYEKEKIV